MKTMMISEFKAKCISVLKTTAKSHEPVLITHRGKPLAKVEPFYSTPSGRTLGGLRGVMKIRGDIIHSDFAEDWEATSK